MTWLRWFTDGVARMLSRWLETHHIGRNGMPNYLTRWVLWGKIIGRPGEHRVFIHRFRASDLDEHHDHPWAFWSLILGPGYWERTPDGRRVWYGPLSLLRRPAKWMHSVEIPEGAECWTIIWTGPKVRSWGFLCPQGWMPWREHLANTASGKNGCG